MPALAKQPEPSEVVIQDAVALAVGRTLAAICGEAPVQAVHGTDDLNLGACVAGIMSFVGDEAWSLALVLPGATALSLIRKFAGFDIALASSDMVDAVGELANVVAGDVAAVLHSRRLNAQLSLPTVVRGSALELLATTATTRRRLDFVSKHGPFCVLLQLAKPQQLAGGTPGARVG